MYPVQDSYKLDYFLSLNYRRLSKIQPDYGYINLPPLSDHEMSNMEEDGIWKVFFNGSANILIKLSKVINFEYKSIFKKSLHCLNHVMISPDGDKFIFIHRYYFKKVRYDRLFLSCVKNGQISLISDNKMVSHCCWKDNHSIIAFLKGPNGSNAFWIIDINNLTFTQIKSPLLITDGHPSVYDAMVVDSYQISLMYNI